MAEKETIIYGFHAVASYLSKHPDKVIKILIDNARHDQRMLDVVEFAKKLQIPVENQQRKALNLLTESEHHQGIVAIVASLKLPDNLEDFLPRITSPFLLVLDGVQDPHNLGACLRTANAAGVDAVIAPKDRAVGITPIVTKVASGALLHTPFFQVTNLARTLAFLKENGVWLYGASEHAEQLYNEVDMLGSIAVIMGSEGKGLRRLTEEHCDYLIKIPMLGAVPSLNVSVATGICLFEAVRQNHAKRQ